MCAVSGRNYGCTEAIASVLGVRVAGNRRASRLPLQMPLAPCGQAALERVSHGTLDEALPLHLVEDALQIDERHTEAGRDRTDEQ